MSEYVKIKRKLYDELIEIKAKYVTLCKMLETMQAVYEENKPISPYKALHDELHKGEEE